MSDLTRVEAIAELTEHLNHWERLLKEGICGKEYGERTIKSFELAIDSLKTDEAYQIEYEKRDFIEIPEGTTNGQMIQAIFPHATIWKSLNDICLYVKGQGDAQVFDWDWWNSPYRKE